MRTLSLILLAGLLVACSDSTTAPQPEPGPVHVRIEQASQRQTSATRYEVTAALRNHGGLGYFSLEFWSLPTSPTGQHRHWGTTEAVQVSAGYGETLTYRVETSGSHIGWIVVRVRDSGSAAWKESQCYSLGSACP